VSEENPHGASTIHASKGGGGSKWLIGAAAAVLLLGAGYVAWTNFAPGQNSTETATNDEFSPEPLRAGPLEPDQDTTADSAASDESAAAPAPAETRATSPARRATPRAAAPVPEEVVGITPASATTVDSDEIVVTARRPIWSRTPSERRLSALYPQRALDRGREGEASLACTVQGSGVLDCESVSATPGFGAAALRVARTFRHSTTLADGSAAAGTPVNLRVVFRMAEEDRRGRRLG
jgi:TonB family protein